MCKANALRMNGIYRAQKHSSSYLPQKMKISHRENIWPFPGRGRIEEETASVLQHDLQGFKGGAKFRIRVTPEMKNMIIWTSQKAGASCPDVIRAMLFQRLYGQIAYEQLHAAAKADLNPQVEMREPPATWLSVLGMDEDFSVSVVPVRGLDNDADHGVRFSRSRVGLIQEFGRATETMEMAMPNRMRTELEELASTDGLNLQNYVRYLLLSFLQGERRASDFKSLARQSPFEDS